MDLVTRKRFFGDSPVSRALRLWAQHAEVLWIVVIVEARPPRRLLPRGLELFGRGALAPLRRRALRRRPPPPLSSLWRSEAVLALSCASRGAHAYAIRPDEAPWYAMVRKHVGVCLRFRLFVWLFVWVRGGLGVLFANMACLQTFVWLFVCVRCCQTSPAAKGARAASSAARQSRTQNWRKT